MLKSPCVVTQVPGNGAKNLLVKNEHGKCIGRT